MTRVQQIINAVAEAARKPKKTKRLRTDAIAQATPLMDPKEMDTFVLTSLGYGDMLLLLAYQEKGVDVGGRVTRSSHHYSHSHTVTFELSVDGYYDLPENEQVQVEELANKVEEQVKEEVVDCSNKIYRALEREYDYQTSEETAREYLNDGDDDFSEEGERGEGELAFSELSPDAQERAIEKERNYRYEDPDTDWAEHLTDEWKTELEEMGFSDPEIAWSGFSSQGDGASFTCRSFDLQKFANFFTSGKDKERGHPYTDALFAEEYKQEAEARAAAQAQAQQPPPPAAESLVSKMLEADDPEMREYADAAVRGAVDIGSVMTERPVRYMSGAKQYEWSRVSTTWQRTVKAKVTIFSDELPDQAWDISILIKGSDENVWWELQHSVSTHDEKVQFSLNVSKFIPELNACVRDFGDELLLLKPAAEKMFNSIFGTNEHFYKLE